MIDDFIEKCDDGNILVLRDFSCCMNCGQDEIHRTIIEKHKYKLEKIKHTGYLFYHEQETSSIAEKIEQN